MPSLVVVFVLNNDEQTQVGKWRCASRAPQKDETVAFYEGASVKYYKVVHTHWAGATSVHCVLEHTRTLSAGTGSKSD